MTVKKSTEMGLLNPTNNFIEIEWTTLLRRLLDSVVAFQDCFKLLRDPKEYIRKLLLSELQFGLKFEAFNLKKN